MALRSGNPLIYEINTWVWLGELSRAHNRQVTLADVPAAEWDHLATVGFDAVWFMGVWERSPAGIAIANQNAGLLEDFSRALPDYQSPDNVGSPYCVRRYEVDAHLGGRAALAAARAELARRGLALVLDFVPNHVALDHPWTSDHPDYFVRGTTEDLQRDPPSFIEAGDHVFARGRDPYFAAWPDVVQLNAFDPGLRRGAIDTLSDIATQCDGVRCDMAMLLINEIFERTWGHRVAPRPATEYWVDAIAAVKQAHPSFAFIAEAYWDREWDLQQQGFDFCYDKRLYDRLEHADAEAVRGHLSGDGAYQNKLVRFIENHDEPRAAAAFTPQRAKAAAVTVATIPGARLMHEGQFEGRRVRVPVFLGRRPDERVDADVQAFYRTLLEAASSDSVRTGEWRLCDRTGWPDNASYLNLVAWCWRSAEERLLVVVNLSDADADGLIAVPWDDVSGRTWQMTDIFAGQTYEREGRSMFRPGLYVALAPWAFHVLADWSAIP